MYPAWSEEQPDVASKTHIGAGARRLEVALQRGIRATVDWVVGVASRGQGIAGDAMSAKGGIVVDVGNAGDHTARRPTRWGRISLKPHRDRVAPRLGVRIRSPRGQGRWPGSGQGSTVGVKVEVLEARVSATVPADSVGRFAAVKGMLRRPGRSGAVADGAAFVEPVVEGKPVARIVLTALDCRYACAGKPKVVSGGPCRGRIWADSRVTRHGRHLGVLLRLLARVRVDRFAAVSCAGRGSGAP